MIRAHHRLLRSLGREMLRVPRPLAYNFHARLRPPLGALLAWLHLTQPGFRFVQIGANDGVLQDPLQECIERFKLSGVLVEPQPELFVQLQAKYHSQPGVVTVQAAIGPTDGTRTLYRLNPAAAREDWMTGAASFDRNHLIRHLSPYPDLLEQIESVPVRTLTPNTLLAESAIDRIDALIVDVEGYDFEILKLFDLPRRLPAIVQYEHRHLTQADWEASLEMLVSAGYRISHTFEDTLAARADLFPE